MKLLKQQLTYKRNIVDLMKTSNIDRNKLARDLGCSVEWLRQIENDPGNGKDASVKFLNRIADYFGIDLSELLSDQQQWKSSRGDQMKCPYPQYTNIGIKKRLAELNQKDGLYDKEIQENISYLLNADFPEQDDDIELVRDLVNFLIVQKAYSGKLEYFDDHKLIELIFRKIPMYFRKYKEDKGS